MSEITEGYRVPDEPSADERPAKTWQDYGREWLDTLVVAISVAMCFRAYFFEPFNIPTGSMQPTLYGNHYRPCETPGFWDTTPVLRWGRWLLTGYDYKELTAPCDGLLVVRGRMDGRKDLIVCDKSGRTDRAVAKICVPADAPLAPGVALTDAYADAQGNRVSGPPYAPVRRGQRLFRGYDVTGDFIFVNRLTWNFRQPRRGDVMVFSTTGIQGLQQGTHYIKRMAGVPGETVDFAVSDARRQPFDGTPGYDLVGNGAKVAYDKPTGARGEPPPAPSPLPKGSVPGKVWDPPYVLRNEPGARDYLAFGDNSYPVQRSLDSRYFGPVPEEKLRGCASVVFWPFNPRWGAIK